MIMIDKSINAASYKPIDWKIEWRIRQSNVILKGLMESDGVWHVELERMDHMWLFILITTRNPLWHEYNKNRIWLVVQWEIGRNRMESAQWDADFRVLFSIEGHVAPDRNHGLGYNTPTIDPKRSL